MEKGNEVYVVVANGYRHRYGQEMFLIGVFDDEVAAREAAEKEEDGAFLIIEKNKAFHLNDDKHEATNDYYIGGFVE